MKKNTLPNKTNNIDNIKESKIIDDQKIVKNEDNITKLQALKFESYIQESGITKAFQIIFSELISKQINPDNYFTYVCIRLREIGKEIDSMKKFDSDEADGINKDEDNSVGINSNNN